MFGTTNKYLTISINEGIIKVAQVDSSGTVERVARGAYTVGSSADEAAKSLKSLLLGFNRSLPVISVVPASAATTKTIEVPSSDPEEIKSIINLQASRYTPYSREEVLISYVSLGINASNNTRLLLVIVHRDIVKERTTILEKVGLDADKIMFAPEPEARFYAKALNLKRDSAPTGIIDFSLNATTYMVVARNSLLFVRHIPIGIKTLIEGTDAVTKLQDELKKSMEAFVQEEGSEAPKFYNLTSAREAVNNVLPVLKTGLGVDFKVVPFANFVKGAGDVRKKLQSDFADDSFLDVVAPASSALKCEVNLMPEEMVLKKTVDLQSKEVSKSGVAAVIIMVLVGAMIMSDIYFKDTFLNKNLRDHFASEKKEVQMLQTKMNKVKLVRQYMKGRMASLDIIHDLSTITPRTIYLNSISVDEDGTVSIDGIADSMALVYSFVKSIDDSKKFREAQLKSTTTKKDNGKDVAAFDIEFKADSINTTATNSPTKGAA